MCMLLMEKKEESSARFARLMMSLEVKIQDSRQNYKALSYFMGDAWPLLPVIKRVPNMLREEKEQAYTPSVVSIGPIHSRNEFLKTMEADKLSYMRFLFERTESCEQTRKDCVVAMLGMEETFKKCYPDHEANYKVQVDDVTTCSLIEMILIDGCFIIELMYRKYKEEKDPILEDAFRHSAVLRDLLLLENQIPFIALQKLFQLTVERIDRSHRTPNLIECVLSFFGDIIGFGDTDDFRKKDGTPPPYHILHLLHICYQHPPPPPPPPTPVPVTQPAGVGAHRHEQPTGVHEAAAAATQPVVNVYIDDNAGEGCARLPVPHLKKHGYQGTVTQLDFEGVKLRKRKTKNLFDVHFSRSDGGFFFWRGRLEIPRFCVYNFTDSLWRNLIAFEQCSPWIRSDFTSHAFLMDILIDSVEDVKLLEKAGVICNHLGSSESVLHIFNGIFKNIAHPQPFHYGDLWKRMKRFRNPFREQLGIVIRNLGGNLWIVISVIGALFIFTLALLQTIYSVYSAYSK